MRTTLSTLLLLSLSLAGCATDVTDELAVEETTELDGKLDSASTTGFHDARRVVARCLEPECRGLQIARVNRTTTPCLDGTTGPSCFVPDTQIDWSETGLGTDEISRLHATLPYGPGPAPGAEAPVLLRGERRGSMFAVTEVWRASAHDDLAPTGVIVHVRGPACAAGSCERGLTERKLNSTLTAALGDLDLEGFARDTDEYSALFERLWGETEEGVIIAGERDTLDGRKTRTVTQYWTHVVDFK